MRYILPEEKASKVLSVAVEERRAKVEQTSDNFRFATAVASFGMLLRDSPYKGKSSYAGVLDLARTAMQPDPSGYRAELLELTQIAQRLSGPPQPPAARKD